VRKNVRMRKTKGQAGTNKEKDRDRRCGINEKIDERIE